ncbi:MAG: hypothetical protein D6757_06330, partial [Alphaproteobacteria bacterium]
IVAVRLENEQEMFGLCCALLEEGVYVNIARPPATPQGMHLLRCSLGLGHSAEQVEEILAAFQRAGRRIGLPISETPPFDEAARTA